MRDGRFAGAAIVSFDVMMLKDTWDSLGLDALSTVSLIREDGQLVARYPLAEGPLDLSKYVLFTDYLPKNAVGSYPALSPADGITRIVGYRKVPGTPFVALASVSSQSAFSAVLAQYLHNARVRPADGGGAGRRDRLDPQAAAQRPAAPRASYPRRWN